jgi:uncharacterized protein YndB with AHSA1/START domain
MAARNKPNELYITRVYDAPVKMVWDAYTDPKQAAHWWGPRGFTITTKSKDLRPGGQWVYTMHGPDGKDWPNIATYHEIEKYSRLVYDHGATENTPPLFRVTVDFSEIGKNKTKMDMTMTLATEQAAKETKKFIKDAGGNSTWDRLGEYLAKETQGKEKFVINRTFEAPLDVMYEMWANPKHLSQWLAPTGMTMEYIRAEVKPGGTSFFMMTNGDFKMYGTVHYLEMSKPNRLVYTQQFADEKENVSRHPMAPTWPETMMTTVTFSEEGPNATRVTVEWEVHGAATREEMETFIKERGGMTQGWTGSFDKLEKYLRTV